MLSDLTSVVEVLHAVNKTVDASNKLIRCFFIMKYFVDFFFAKIGKKDNKTTRQQDNKIFKCRKYWVNSYFCMTINCYVNEE